MGAWILKSDIIAASNPMENRSFTWKLLKLHNKLSVRNECLFSRWLLEISLKCQTIRVGQERPDTAELSSLIAAPHTTFATTVTKIDDLLTSTNKTEKIDFSFVFRDRSYNVTIFGVKNGRVWHHSRMAWMWRQLKRKELSFRQVIQVEMPNVSVMWERTQWSTPICHNVRYALRPHLNHINETCLPYSVYTCWVQLGQSCAIWAPFFL